MIVGISKKEADAYDQLLDAAAAIADLLETSGIRIAEDELEELCLFLARNAATLRLLLKGLKPITY
jgi:dsDNA-binding SOS-regulon protein